MSCIQSVRARTELLALASALLCLLGFASSGYADEPLQMNQLLSLSPYNGASYDFYIDGSVQGHSRNFILDTGSQFTVLTPDPQTNNFSSVGTQGIAGAAGGLSACDIVSAPDFSIDTSAPATVRALRCNAGDSASGDDSNILGIDWLNNRIFSMNFSEDRFSILDSEPAGTTMAPIEKTSLGFIKIPITVPGGISGYAVVDTHWDITSIDPSALQLDQFPDGVTYGGLGPMPVSVEFANSGSFTDLTGQSVSVNYYEISTMQVGMMNLGNQIAAAYALPDTFKKAWGNDVIAILGTNTISQFNWVFDLKNNRYSQSCISSFNCGWTGQRY